ncbi:glycosyltransferase family 4 protein [Caulobacter sp. LjRoot300]|uniref:glycosyltransferase family 4 protein n=1 Tax=Caulobacter sp. LjRoot300 TaxID=3342321 RepID=UPI003ECE38A4
MKYLRDLTWRHAPAFSQAVSTRLPALRAYRLYGWRRRARPPRVAPITVAGFHGAVLGLGEAVRSTTLALSDAGVGAGAWDISELMGHARRLSAGDPTPPAPGPGMLIAQMNPPELIRLISTTGAAAFEGKYVIGYWAWELSEIPALWKPAFRYVDEVWALSEFTADAVRRAAPRRVKVRVMPIAVPLNDTPAARGRFGFGDETIVLCAFDFRSTIARKNPLAALDAFRRAKARARRPATLVFKTVGGADAPEPLRQLRDAIGDDGDVVLMTETLSAAERDQLLASCDILLSLHRSEGFGLFPAEAMAAGKAVVATAWSGNLDFMDNDCAVLVPYELRAVEDGQGIYAGGLWAEADTQAAGQALIELIDDPGRRAQLGAKARAMIQRRLAPTVVAARMCDALGPAAAPKELSTED